MFWLLVVHVDDATEPACVTVSAHATLGDDGACKVHHRHNALKQRQVKSTGGKHLVTACAR